MSYRTQYVHLPDDKAEHIIGDGQRTACGEAIPYNSPWTTEPEGSVCSKCKTMSAKADETAAALDELREAEILGSAPPAVEAPLAEPEPAKAETPKAKAKSGSAK
jgi:hypothetical protein